MNDTIKLFVAFFSYFVIAPAAAIVVARSQRLLDLSVFVLIFCLGLHIDQTVIMVGSIEWYRGVTKGFEFNVMSVMAILIIVATAANPKTPLRLLPTGTLAWCAYVGSSALSLLSALNASYVFMSILKFGQAWLIAFAIANYVRSTRQIHTVLSSLAILIFYQFFVVAKMKWIDGFYQVRGLFEHQNPLAMFTYMATIPLLAAALSPQTSKLRATLYYAAFTCGAIIILAALSRASLAVFALGVLATVTAGFADRFTSRRVLNLLLMALGATALLAATFDTIVGRFNDEGNDASGETRVVMNRAAKAMLDQNPFGVGWNNFGKAINHPYPYGDVIDDWNRDRGQAVDPDYAKGVTESHYWLILAENGLPGFVSYLFFIGLIHFHLLRLTFHQRGSLSAALASGILIAFTLTYLHSTLERVLTQTKNLGLWMLLIGLTAALLQLKKAPNT